MKYIIILLLCFFVGDDCGKERWDVKTLTDLKAKNINFKSKKTTVKKLTEIKNLLTIRGDTPRLPAEYHTYTIQCKIREYRSEDDGDFHLVLMDLKDTTITMIGEIPSPECDVMADCPKLTEITYAFNDFYAKYKMSRNRVQPGEYKITGVMFFDKLHGQLGCAPNGSELHPIYSIEKVK